MNVKPKFCSVFAETWGFSEKKYIRRPGFHRAPTGSRGCIRDCPLIVLSILRHHRWVYIFCLGEIYVRFVSSVYLLRVDEAVRGTLKRLLIRHRQRPWGDLEANDIGMIPTLEGEELPS